jgi:hypothetical protein
VNCVLKPPFEKGLNVLFESVLRNGRGERGNELTGG